MVENQIYHSIEDYRGWRKTPGGLFITSGPTDAIMSISGPIRKNHSPVGRELRMFMEKNRGVQLISDEGYAGSLVRELYDMLVLTDGAANFDDGRLTAVKRYIEGITGTGNIEGGARHRAAAFASKMGLASYVLSHETGNITIFEHGMPVLFNRWPNRQEDADCPAVPLLALD